MGAFKENIKNAKKIMNTPNINTPSTFLFLKCLFYLGWNVIE